MLFRSKNSNEDNDVSSITNTVDKSDLDNELRAMIINIRETLTRLGSILTNKERKEISKELYETLKKVNDTNRNTRLRKRQKKDY